MNRNWRCKPRSSFHGQTTSPDRHSVMRVTARRSLRQVRVPHVHELRRTPAEEGRRDHRTPANPSLPHLTVVQGGEPRALVQRALADQGGTSRFVSRQDVVAIKPNIAWDRTPEQAANTNPEIVAEAARNAGRLEPNASLSPKSVATSRAAASNVPAFRPRRVPRAPKSSFPIRSSFARSIWVASCSNPGPS